VNRTLPQAVAATLRERIITGELGAMSRIRIEDGSVGPWMHVDWMARTTGETEHERNPLARAEAL